MSAATATLPKPSPVSIFLELTKLRISGASTFTAAAGYVAFLRGANAGLITTLLGILLLAMGSSAFNEVQEHKLDALMPRTANRPIPRGDLTPAMAAIIAGVMAISGFLVLWLAHNLTSALLGALALVWYNGFYTPLKRVSAFAVVPGSLIGALPPAIGWTAAGGGAADPSVLALAFVFFIWQVPHFWLLVGLHAEGYEEAGYPTLVGLFGRPRLSRLTFTWTCGTAAACGLLPMFRVLVSRPAEIMLGLGAVWLVIGSLPLLNPGQDAPLYRRVFMNINLFALVLTAAVILDPFFSR
ncbi:protoheme IX farnesyltransferase [Geothrix sp. PMB-07]|uniref:protoheme IX farnesyltransferase n=1 Tax=Geothrix sp. PMB-07 TaxID=3068640 RepID=UPI0027415A52|nr:protoheme IX farnesyltransferase [Geothrix sp. PMB-07]WLT31299.1 protoheme IX farnesyltransferase [Geothrix sp. PMB-07]